MFGACWKRSIIGSHHKISAKHLPAYLNEIAFRFNNRDNPNLFLGHAG